MSLTTINTGLTTALLNLDGYARLGKGQVSDINKYSERDKPLYWWVIPYTESLGNINSQNRYIEGHPISIYVVDQDDLPSTPDDSFVIIETCEALAQKLLMHIYEYFEGDLQAEITSATIQHVIKMAAQNNYTGVVLRLTISLPNTETIC